MADTASDSGQKTSSTTASGFAKSTESKADAKGSESAEVRDGRVVPDRQPSEGPDGFDANPHGNYDLMSVEDLRAEAKRLDVRIPRDVEKAHLITALRAGVTSPR
jgi:hypothetical protein